MGCRRADRGEMMTIDLTNGVVIVLAILGLIGGLVKLIRDSDMKRITSIEKDLEAIKTSLASAASDIKSNRAMMDGHVANHVVSEHRIEDVASKTSDMIKAHSEEIADIRESIAGFGSNYVLRKEFFEDGRKHKERQ
jgi:hypothetical protein